MMSLRLPLTSTFSFFLALYIFLRTLILFLCILAKALSLISVFLSLISSVLWACFSSVSFSRSIKADYSKLSLSFWSLLISSSRLVHSLTSCSSIRRLRRVKQASSEVGGKAFSKARFSRIYSMSSISTMLAGSPLPNLRLAILSTSGKFSLSMM